MNDLGKRKVSFEYFIARFEVIELPVTLGSDTHHEVSQHNAPLPPEMMEQYVADLDLVEVDEFTEAMPVFRIPNTKGFVGVVLWVASLLEYGYWLLTFDEKGDLLDKQQIGGMRSAGQKLVQSVTTMNENWAIYVVEGGIDLSRRDVLYDAASSRSFTYQLQSDGKVVESLMFNTES